MKPFTHFISRSHLDVTQPDPTHHNRRIPASSKFPQSSVFLRKKRKAQFGSRAVCFLVILLSLSAIFLSLVGARSISAATDCSPAHSSPSPAVLGSVSPAMRLCGMEKEIMGAALWRTAMEAIN
ncbi:hypothetical protein AKJ16_DCAP22360 [Drosera capensis]